MQESFARSHEIDAAMVSNSSRFQTESLKRASRMMFASNERDLQGHVDRYDLFKKENHTYQPTPFTHEWCDPPPEDDKIDLTLGVNPFFLLSTVWSRMTIRDQNKLEQMKSQHMITFHITKRTAAVLMMTMMMNSVKPMQNTHCLCIITTKWDWCTKMTPWRIMLLGNGVPETPGASEQESTDWQDANEEEAGIFVTGIATAPRETLTAEGRYAAYKTYDTLTTQCKGT